MKVAACDGLHMKTRNQSPEKGIADGLHTLSYIADTQGNQELVSGEIWQPVNIVNQQAWQEIEKHIALSKEKISSGRVSCLHYYMTANQMNTCLLAQYTRQARWRVFLHLVPFFYKRLPHTTISRYAEIFQVTADDLIQGKLRPPVYTHGNSRRQPVD